MPAKGKKAAAAPKQKNGYRMAPPIRQGEIITDNLFKKKWRIGPSIGVGGFGEIYSACEVGDSAKKDSDYCYAIKIEPSENGPLFVERSFYIRNANKDDIANWMKENNLKTFGMPTSYGNGSFEYDGDRYRYLVLERFGRDIWSSFKENGRQFPVTTVFQLGLQMIDVLEFIHHQGYVHADIKGANILLGLKKATENQAYLVDFGLACRIALDKPFKPDPKCAHNGTIEYTSRDAHLGVSTMRGDLEILGYNMLQWIVGELPWENCLKQPKQVQDAKEAFMKNVRKSCEKLPRLVPEPLIKYFEYINTLKPKEAPDYAKCREFFESYLKKEGKTKNSKLEFSVSKIKAKNSSTAEAKSKLSNDKPKAKRGRKAPAKEASEENSEEINERDDEETEPEPKKKTKESPSKISKTKRDRKPAKDSTETENEESDVTHVEKRKQSKKRKSTEPSLVVKVKKTKLAPKPTPPAKKDHVNTATQTSLERRRSLRVPQVSFDSPVSSIIDENNKRKVSLNSSGDIFEDSFEIEEKKVKPKKKLIIDEEVTVKRVVKKKTTVKAKGKSWRDLPTIVNGRSAPVGQ